MAQQTEIDITLAIPATASATTIGAAVGGFHRLDHIALIAELQGLTGGTLDIFLQDSWDGGTTWLDVVHFTQLGAGAAAIVYRAAAQLDSTIQTIGEASSLTLAAGKICGLPWGPMLRVVAKSGTGVSAGAYTAKIRCLLSRTSDNI